ncbi:hypothetical protein KM043_009313 [Ampulex compressa]|nr:hypothetical protein KM043_009313 [Ampulex compressa]
MNARPMDKDLLLRGILYILRRAVTPLVKFLVPSGTSRRRTHSGKKQCTTSSCRDTVDLTRSSSYPHATNGLEESWKRWKDPSSIRGRTTVTPTDTLSADKAGRGGA